MITDDIKDHTFKCHENGLLYRVIDVSGGEVVATTKVKQTEEFDSFSWLSDMAHFNMNFTRVS